MNATQASSQRSGRLSGSHLVEQARTIIELHQENPRASNSRSTSLLQRAFRHRSERYLDDPNQLKLDFGNTPEAADAAEGLAEAVEEAEQIIAEHKRRVPQAAKGAQRVAARPPAPLRSHARGARGSRSIAPSTASGSRSATTARRRWNSSGPSSKVRVTQIPKYRLRRPAGVRRDRTAAAGRPGRRQPLRHERGRRDHHQQVRLSPADLSPAGSVRRQRLDARAEHAVEHPGGLGGLHPAVRRAICESEVIASGAAGHRRDACDAASAAGDSRRPGKATPSRSGSTRS